MVNFYAYLSPVLLIQELTQNAEDAKASQLKFLYDKKRYKATYLYDEELAQFQVKLIITLHLANLFHFVVVY